MLRITQSILIHNPEKMFLLKVFIKTHGNCLPRASTLLQDFNKTITCIHIKTNHIQHKIKKSHDFSRKSRV